MNNLTTLGGQAFVDCFGRYVGERLGGVGSLSFLLRKGAGMKGSLIVVGFALGCLLGWSGYLPGVIIENDITVYVIYLLMFQVGLA